MGFVTFEIELDINSMEMIVTNEIYQHINIKHTNMETHCNIKHRQSIDTHVQKSSKSSVLSFRRSQLWRRHSEKVGIDALARVHQQETMIHSTGSTHTKQDLEHGVER